MKSVNHVQTVPVVLMRHAQSLWNQENRFTGWADPPLTANGIAEARRIGNCLNHLGYQFDVAYSSCLQRAIVTLDMLLDNLGQPDIPMFDDWRLNERHYGVLQGMNKTEATARYGVKQVWRWRRGYLDKAEAIADSSPDHPIHDPRYAHVPDEQLPGVENLAQTRSRVASFWQEQIVPRVQQGERILISAHGNSLRALMMELSGMSVEEVEAFEIPTASPIEYLFDHEAKPLAWRYLNDGEHRLCA